MSIHEDAKPYLCPSTRLPVERELGLGTMRHVSLSRARDFDGRAFGVDFALCCGLCPQRERVGVVSFVLGILRACEDAIF